jgi:hypothetical protein
MTRSLVTKKSFRLPTALENLFDNPPLVGNERREDYDAFCLEIEIALGPTDFILWMQIREFADISWELRRERRIKAAIYVQAKGGSKADHGHDQGRLRVL